MLVNAVSDASILIDGDPDIVIVGRELTVGDELIVLSCDVFESTDPAGAAVTVAEGVMRNTVGDAVARTVMDVVIDALLEASDDFVLVSVFVTRLEAETLTVGDTVPDIKGDVETDTVVFAVRE